MKPVFEWVYTPQPDHRSRPDQKASSGAIANRIEQAFDSASSSTGTPFEYLLKTAERESSMNPAAKAKTSSAAGLFQFIESTWLETMKRNGPDLGLGHVADQITADGKGRYTVADPEARKAILDLRFDPEIASMMAGALTRSNAAHLSSRLGRDPTAGELYIAHFFGAGGATRFIRQVEESPDAAAADLFPKQAAANRPIFYEQGRARSMVEVYANLVGRHGETVPTPSPTLLAFSGDSTVPAAASALDMSDPAQRVRAGWGAAEPRDAFDALFRTDHPEIKASAAAAFYRGFAHAPGLFAVAVAEDARQLGGADPLPPVALSAPAAAPPAASGASIAGAARRTGPLDLSAFLDIDES